ncbi:MAG: gephyrin-like molybdotransferase Glp [Sandaracinaceae bacterium]
MAGRMVELEEAFTSLATLFGAGRTERVGLDEALGRHLAESIVARSDEPGFDNGAMDGYAVRSADLAGATPSAPVWLTVEGESRAGGPLPRCEPGRAVRSFTGARIPDGADTVVMQEDVTREADRARFDRAPETGEHVRRRGEVLRAGDRVLEPGARLGPGEIGACASQSKASVLVYVRPRVAILGTGDELREIGDPLEPGMIVDSNGHALAAAVRAAGGIPSRAPLIADRESLLAARLEEAASSSDIVLTVGGASVGDHDHVPAALDALGARVLFEKVRMKPGKPVRLAVLSRAVVLALPGNPVSALVAFELFARPIVRSRLGDERPFRPAIDVELARDMRGPDSRPELARARLELRQGALPRAWPPGDQGSAAITSWTGSDALLYLPRGAGRIAAGTRMRALDLASTRGAASPPRLG